MALITCPKCGKQISDTTEKCIHCGYDLRESKEGQTELKQYYKLSSAEQNRLRSEFYSHNPKFAENKKIAEKYRKKILASERVGKVSGIIIVILIILAVISFAVTKSEESPLFIIFGCFAVIAFIISICSTIAFFTLYHKSKKYSRNALIIEKKYQKWLKDKKHIKYTVNFAPIEKRAKAFFDNVDADRAVLED